MKNLTCCAIITSVSVLGFAAHAQQRVYLSDLVSNIPSTDSIGDFRDIDALPSGTSVATGPGLVFVLDPEADGFSLGSNTLVLDGASPAGGNFIGLPLQGPADLTLVGVDTTSVLDEFGRPLDLVPGETYEAVFWVRPGLVQDPSGDQFFLDVINPQPTLFGLPDPNLSAELNGWTPAEWSEYTITFV